MEALFANPQGRLRFLCGVRVISNHKFRVGEIVEFKPGRMGFPAASRECTIVRLLPIEGGNFQYRIKCVTEAFERVVPEAQLAGRV
jgi:hypothetical protein